MPPSAPILEVHFTTARSIRLHWNQPEDGGAIIQGRKGLFFPLYDGNAKYLQYLRLYIKYKA